MHWSNEFRYKLLLKLNNAAISHHTKEGLFNAIAAELKKNFSHDRLSINLYDSKSRSISYFASADGISPKGISTNESRSVSKGSISQLVITSEKPVIIEDLTLYSHLASIPSMIRAKLKSTMAFPMIIRKDIIGSIHFSFRNKPKHINELTEIFFEVSRQIAISVENMLNYNQLKKINAKLLLQRRFLISDINAQHQQDEFIHVSQSMADVIHKLEQVADTDMPVLLTGETGTGKSYLARYIHNLSLRKNQIFVKINCPSLTPSLFESELFGYSKGAFTGANTDRIGRFEIADGGTIFLDEIGELPLVLQAKLLQAFQDMTFERVGDSRTRKINSRVISATNVDIESAIEAGLFRRDLLYRINTFTINIPPLRERVEDIPILIKKINEIESEINHRSPPIYTDEAIKALCYLDWSGNVRELKNFIKQIIVLKPGEKIYKKDVRKIYAPFDRQKKDTETNQWKLSNAERQHIEKILTKTKGVIAGSNGAAKLLGLPRSTLQYRLKTHRINPKNFS
ncbi:sigma-54-dependent Fis family transcriptional regulator [Desulfobacula sp.]|uniref:sigma-54-dependent Fis family transcriptional regulator n=1 Tax=Desulfobacula sp. TaxID=2593537 RepID=UPI0027148062|nr:sigma-54-dependent Fis family transcriptional regulator [Desulfobacula sp.]